jgi:hypothetical protein
MNENSGSNIDGASAAKANLGIVCERCSNAMLRLDREEVQFGGGGGGGGRGTGREGVKDPQQHPGRGDVTDVESLARRCRK